MRAPRFVDEPAPGAQRSSGSLEKLVTVRVELGDEPGVATHVHVHAEGAAQGEPGAVGRLAGEGRGSVAGRWAVGDAHRDVVLEEAGDERVELVEYSGL